MSNNMVSQQLPIPNMQISQMEPMVNKVDSSEKDLQMGLLGPVCSDPMSQQQPISNDQVGLLRATPDNPGSQGLSMSIMRSGQVESRSSNLSVHQLLMPNRQTMQMGSMINSMGHQRVSMTHKRKAPVEMFSNSYMTANKRVAQMEHRPWLQQVSASNKGAPSIQPLSSAPRPQHLPASSKRKTQMEPTSSKSGTPRSMNSKSQNTKVQQFSKVQSESSESVRSKMRESLAAALALVSQQDKSQAGNSSTLNEVASSQVKVENSSQCAGSASTATDASQWPKQETFRSGDSSSGTTASVDHVIGEHRIVSTSNEDFSSAKLKDNEAETRNISNNEMILHTMEVSNCDTQEFNTSYTLTTDDVPFSDNFFVKDELLQGNGLSWVMESEMGMTDQKESHTNEQQRLEPYEVGGGKEHAVHSPELLASRIEEELFKLFGGVNKKYKEKGRSLLFNLKDRNNPELRERVMSGEIPPERLCSMTAEELASEELSQWRIAKAEELAQMVVLPDDADLRRLVKKTHKGEVQVEVEHDDNVSMVVSGGTTSVAQNQTEEKDVEAPRPSKTDGIKGGMNSASEKSSSGKDNTVRLTIPSNDGTDPMQGLMADDALKDADFLPPIVSLDEFMESLHSEPPFENLPVESGKTAPISDKDDTDGGSELKTSNLTPSELDDDTDKSEKIHQETCPNVEAYVKKEVNAERGAVISDNLSDTKLTDDHSDSKPANVNVEVRLTDDTKSASSRAELEVSQGRAGERNSYSHSYSYTTVAAGISKGESIWEGTLQLNISVTQPVIGIFKSGEKTSVKDWPGFLEIKGRVRLDAFEKFLQELPMSRSRAIMVVHFVSKESPPKNEQSTLQEAADSYIVDERVGFAEPVPRVELYFCPPHKKTVDMLSKVLTKEQIEAFNAIDNGLIGVLVWRKTHLTSSVSPTSSSHHKHSSKKQYFSSRRQQDTNMNANPSPKQSLPKGMTITEAGPPSDDDDDVPPGFGPAVARDEDDLPEFNFSGGVNPVPRVAQKPMGPPGVVPFHSVNQTTSRPVQQMRELVQKYGQNKTIVPCSGNWQDKFGATIQPWNDDDDDIPEWQPQTLQNQFPPQQQHDSSYQLRPHLLNQPYAVSSHQPMMQSRQHVMNATQPNVVPQWVPTAQGNNLQPSNFNGQAIAGQPYGAPVQGVAWRQNIPRSRGF
ncbi:hypothetical protein L6164_024260 [Bauhinia variegata]|uniref:Uncharacterized protein n=1 Tax=Bauhinia variegata TaxID=167791 RepID=A0ACB9LXA5_BAUVA|nr:hypothetical protein L6164_024260 [Bauhinia variegata]